MSPSKAAIVAILALGMATQMVSRASADAVPKTSAPAVATHADEMVRFQAATVNPSPFREHLAQQRGEQLPPSLGPSLIGYLSRPSGDGPHPAIVVMHGCGGIRPSTKNDWPKRLVSWGYVVLVVDSFTTRNIKNTCRSYLADRVFDAYGAMDFLSKYTFVDKQRIALMGFSAGGTSALEATKAHGNVQFMDQRFKAAVAYYPICRPRAGDADVPTLILEGELDDWSPVEMCRQRVALQSREGQSIKLKTYPAAYHDFDSPEVATTQWAFGHREEYNEAAAKQSFEEVKTFLRKYLSH